MKLLTIFTMSLFFLCSCSSVHKSPKFDTNKLELCKSSCLKQFSLCQKSCTNNIAACSCKQHIQTDKSYSKYINEQTVRGGYLTRELNSFRDPLQCSKTTCDCQTDYQMCIQSCSGKIIKPLKNPKNFCINMSTLWQKHCTFCK